MLLSPDSTGLAQSLPSDSRVTENVSHLTGASNPRDVLPPAQWRRVDDAVERGLAWLAVQQQDDGSFPTLDSGQPAVTSLAVMALLAHGHVPGDGPYGQSLTRAVDYALSCQKRNGLVNLLGPDGAGISRQINHQIGGTATYNHGISSLALSEVYGMSAPEDDERLRRAIERSIVATLQMQAWRKNRVTDQGGWRYIDVLDQSDSDLSVTGWQLMFLRSAQNAGFDVPEERIADAVAYVRRCFDERDGHFIYSQGNPSRTRSMAGAGILALAHAGLHDTDEARRSGEWLLARPFGQYNATLPGARSDRYHYGLFNCCQAMYQLGGKYWAGFYPPAVEAVLSHQRRDGSWPVDSQYHDAPYGSAYTTALAIIMLGAPNQLLPIFQR